MGATCDFDPSRSQWDIVEPIITREYLADLAKRYDFDVAKTRAEWWLSKAAALYVRGRRIEDRPKSRDERLAIEKLAKHAWFLRTELRRDENYDIAFTMDEVAKLKGEPLPFIPTEPSLLAPVEFLAHASYQEELLRLLDILSEALQLEESRIEPDKGGRPSNLGMPDCISYLADFWEHELRRKFTIDYEGGEGITLSFQFAKEIISKLDDVPDTQIITAMRKEVANRRDIINRPK